MSRNADNPPIRTCVGCGERAARGGMLRMRADSSGELLMVLGREVSGRTAYLHAREDCVRALGRSKRLFRSLRKQVAASARERFVELALRTLSQEQAGLRELTVG